MSEASMISMDKLHRVGKVSSADIDCSCDGIITSCFVSDVYVSPPQSFTVVVVVVVVNSRFIILMLTSPSPSTWSPLQISVQ